MHTGGVGKNPTPSQDCTLFAALAAQGKIVLDTQMQHCSEHVVFWEGKSPAQGTGEDCKGAIAQSQHGMVSQELVQRRP